MKTKICKKSRAFLGISGHHYRPVYKSKGLYEYDAEKVRLD
jgi:hypothetical protein